MGQVWRGRDLRLGRDVAIKVMLNPDSDSMSLARFQREAMIAAGLQHPGITVVHDAERHDSWLFIVMELLVGRDLGMILAEHPAGLPPGRMLDLAIQAAEALAAAHEGGIVHRDLKPGNLFVLVDGRLKICDFGIAKDVNATSILTTKGGFIGTPAYASPEQCNGEPVDTRSDLYSLGCVLYHMLVGHPPFAGNDRAVMRQHADARPAPPSVRIQAIPEPLEELVLGLLAKKPTARPATAAEVAATLRRIQDTPRQEVHAPPNDWASFTPPQPRPQAPPKAAPRSQPTTPYPPQPISVISRRPRPGEGMGGIFLLAIGLPAEIVILFLIPWLGLLLLIIVLVVVFLWLLWFFRDGG